MAGVKSLVVRGIRSFGPDDPDEQGISFESPLTLILGQNGCGKTTIIECLRYAITGQMPPGSHNDCFVHDAKVNRSTEVLGQVKLKFTNAKDKPMEVIRSMKVQLLKKKSKFGTVDSLLATFNDNGERKEISMKCAELDSIIQDQLGVSKAILNSVIFCHQEDCSWPLDEGKKVKERFDEIFDSDKYSNCFDRLKKIRKSYATDIKVLDVQVSSLSEQKRDLDKKKLDVVDTETRIEQAELKLSEIAAELKPIEEKIQTIKSLEKKLDSYNSKLKDVKVNLKHKYPLQEDLKKEIKNIIEGTLAELKQQLTNYETTAIAKKKELDESYKKISMFNKEEEKTANDNDSNNTKLQKLGLLESQNEKRIVKRNEMLLDVTKVADIEGITKVENKEEAEKAVTEITEKIKSLKKGLNEQRALGDAEEKEKQVLVDECRDALSRHKQQITNKEKEIQKNKNEVTKLERSISSANESKVQLENAEAKFKAAEEHYEEVAKEVNIEELQQQINEHEKDTEKYENELEEIDDKVKKLQKQSAKLKERDLVEESFQQKDKQLTTLKNKHRSALTELLGEMPEKDFAVTIKKLEHKVNSEVNAIKKTLKGKHTEITKLEAERKHVRDTVNERRAELTKAEDKMYQACGTQSYDSTLSKINTTVKNLQDDHSGLQASMFLISKYEKQLKENSCCPLCNRGFEQETEVTDLISQLNTKAMTLPSQFEKVTEELQRASAKKDELLSMKSLNEKITSLKEKDIPQLEKRLSDVDEKIKTLTETVEELTTSLVEPEQKLATMKQIHGDMPLLDRSIQEITTVTKNLENIKAQCSEVESDMTLDEANAKQSELKKTLSGLKTNIKEASKKLNAHNKKLHKLGEQKNKLKEECLNLQKKVQDIYNLQEKKKQLETDRETYLLELNQLNEAIEPLKVQLKEKEEAKAETVKKNRGIIETKNNYIMEVTNAFNKVKSIEAEIKQHEDKNIPLEKIKTEEAINKCKDKLKQIVNDRQAITKRIESLKDEINKHEINKRELEDNIRLREIQKEIAECEKEEAEINQKLSEISKETLSEKDSLVVQYKKLTSERSKLDGKLDELKNTLKKNKADLNAALNKDTERKYREKFYELNVTKMLDKDIRDYSIALEQCLLEFHKKKMESINLIIRELWSKIYSGNDIDYIAIKAEGSMNTESERRKYEYRVVQCKNGVEIDMRGRCSAGQKVLACLIIRLALAETFSSRFGILALDEPTTNLDQENIKSLCAALGEIVQERMMQKNFMFIIITHDREFIESLGQIDKVTHFYEVSRNDDGKSRIKRVRFS